jgi:hypothetical protein
LLLLLAKLLLLPMLLQPAQAAAPAACRTSNGVHHCS